MGRVSMTWRRAASALFAILFVSALALAPATPAFAHNSQHHEAAEQAPPPTATSAPSAAPDQNAPPMDASQMAWPSGDEDNDGGMMGMHHERPTTMMGRTIAWMGAWHPAIVHFPIALLLTVAFLELAAAVRGKPIYNAGNKLLLALAVISAFAAAPLGWADAGMPAADDKWYLNAHRWLGTAMPFLLLLLWGMKKPAEAAAVKPSPPLYELVLVVSVIAILVQAYLGGDITHGENHMAF